MRREHVRPRSARERGAGYPCGAARRSGQTPRRTQVEPIPATLYCKRLPVAAVPSNYPLLLCPDEGWRSLVGPLWLGVAVHKCVASFVESS